MMICKYIYHAEDFSLILNSQQPSYTYPAKFLQLVSLFQIVDTKLKIYKQLLFYIDRWVANNVNQY